MSPLKPSKRWSILRGSLPAPETSNRSSTPSRFPGGSTRSFFPTCGGRRTFRIGPAPLEGERPAAYIVICRDITISNALNSDQGFSVQNIVLGATERGLGSCVIASFVRDEIRKVMQIHEALDPIWVIALGVPAETIVLEPMGPEGDIRYWRDAAGVHHVPKRSLQEILLTQFWEDE